MSKSFSHEISTHHSQIFGIYIAGYIEAPPLTQVSTLWGFEGYGVFLIIHKFILVEAYSSRFFSKESKTQP